jgi:hypothetical protein
MLARELFTFSTLRPELIFKNDDRSGMTEDVTALKHFGSSGPSITLDINYVLFNFEIAEFCDYVSV